MAESTTSLAEKRLAQATPSAPHVYAAIAAVMADLSKDGIGKTRRNTQQGYDFRGVDDVFNALAPMLAKHEIVIVPRLLSREVSERVTPKGGVLFYVVCQAEFTLISARDGSSVQAVTFGEAMDSGDKATNKAMSAAYKYMAFQTFCIPTEGDNDADGSTHEVAPDARVSPEQIAALQERIDATGADIAKFCAYLKVDALSYLKARDYERALAALAAKAKASKKDGAAK